MMELAKLHLSVNIGKITKDEAIEELRKGLVYSMRLGDRYVLNCGKLQIDFMRDFHDPVNFPIDKIFDFQEWRKEENYKKIVRPEEDVDLMNNKKCYFMNDNFDLIILQDIVEVREDEDKRDEFKTKIPFLKNFETFFVQRYGEGERPKPKEQLPPMIPAGRGMSVVSFQNGNVTHTYHSFDYADIYDPVPKKRGCRY